MNIVYCTAAKTAIVLTLSSELPTDPLLGFQPSDSLHIQMIIITIVIINVIITITITLVINAHTDVITSYQCLLFKKRLLKTFSHSVFKNATRWL